MEYVLSEKNVNLSMVDIVEEDETVPKVLNECPKCNNDTAFRWERYNDDGDIILLYRCRKCRYVWKEADY